MQAIMSPQNPGLSETGAPASPSPNPKRNLRAVPDPSLPHREHTLYKAQQDAVYAMCRKACSAATPGKVRLMLAAETGCGKTAMAIRTATELGLKRILVVCPAIVRRHWAGEFSKWAGRIDVGIIEMGFKRKPPSKKAELIRLWSYSRNVQIVSYDLLGHVNPYQWDMIIIDEAHNVGWPGSLQSKLARNLVKANPSAHILCLSATLMPRSPLQVWHLLYLLGCRDVGHLSKSGNVPWKFIYNYFEVIKNEYGEAPGALRDDKAGELQELVESYAVVVRREDIAPSLPPLRVAPLYVATSGERLYADWLRTMPQDITHAVILPYHHAEAAVAAGVACQIKGVTPFYIDGTMPPGQRSERLEVAAQPRPGLTVLVATQESVSEGIRFMWAQKALITEPQAVPGKLTQLLGRFNSVGSTARPLVEVAIEDGKESVCDIVLERAAEINAVMQRSVADAVTTTFAPQAITAERAEASLSRLFNDAELAPVSEWESDEW